MMVCMSDAARKIIQPATIDDLLSIPEEKRWHEIVNGEIMERACPAPAHGYIQVTMSARLRNPFGGPSNQNGTGGWWFFSDTEVELDRDQIYRPDLMAYRRERMPIMPKTWPLRIRPDWVCEILSPSNYAHDTILKFRNYHLYQVPHYWIIDPERHLMTVYRWSESGYTVVEMAGPGDIVRPEPFGVVELVVSELFGDLEETGG